MKTVLEALNDEEKKEFWACLALKNTQTVGARSIAKLLNHFGSAFDAVHNLPEWGAVGLSSKASYLQSEKWRTPARREWENSRDLEASLVLWTSQEYPQNLKEIPDAPAYFYCLGNKELLNNPSIAIIGSRNCSTLGNNESAYLAKELSACGITVISGMARGIDRAAHIGALQGVGSSIGVLGSGIDVVYPSRNNDIYFSLKEKGLLISEFAPGTPPDPTQFPIRNRIISGLSLGVLVVEADIRSGSLITARLANEQGKSVYAIPGAMGSKFSLGCQELIRQGAKAVFRVEDIIEDLLPLLKAELTHSYKDFNENIEKEAVPQILIKKTKSKKDKEEKPETSKTKNEYIIPEYLEDSLEYKIIQKLKEKKFQLEELCLALEQSPQEITSTLVQMELLGDIERFEGAWFGLYGKK